VTVGEFRSFIDATGYNATCDAWKSPGFQQDDTHPRVNVWEWCQDWYHQDYYRNSPKNDPTGPNGGSFRVLRGGSWYYAGFGCRSGCRRYEDPDYARLSIGFRLVWS
jgi:formylglycine-generating enzyme required for sulfatase activity